MEGPLCEWCCISVFQRTAERLSARALELPLQGSDPGWAFHQSLGKDLLFGALISSPGNDRDHNESPLPGLLRGLNELIYRKGLEQCLTHSNLDGC